jgi:hypothetical protein
MAKKTIEEKIQDVGFWTFGGVIWYLVIAFFLKSKYPIYEYRFNPKDAYDVLKDALTLAAAFLAPVAAFVLFSDWREQHKVISNVEQSRKFNQELKRCIDKIDTDHINFMDFENSEFESFMRMIFDFSATLSSTLQNIYNVNKESETYINNVESIRTGFEKIYASIQATINLNHMSDFIYEDKLKTELNRLIENRKTLIGEIREINLQPLKVS